MSTLRVSSIQDTSGGNASTPAGIANGTAKAWVNFNGTTVVTPASMTGVRASYNVSSIADNGIGDYTINFTTALVDANYATLFTGSAPNSGSLNRSFGIHDPLTAPTASAVRVLSQNSNGNANDGAYMCVAIFR